jgi:putative FmdB family regulatory protein
MPIYEYECGSCGERTEAIQKLNEAPLAICPRCGGPLRKLFSAPSFQFKGSGWYATDYAGKKGGEGEEKGRKPKEGGEAKEGKEGKEKAEAKPEGGGKSGGESAKPPADAGSSKAGAGSQGES